MNFVDDPKHYKSYLDMRNSEEYQLLRQFYHRKTLFDILGVARQENPHSSFLSWLLNPLESHSMGDYPMKRFLETVCFAYSKYGRDYLNEENPTFCSYDTEKQIVAREKLFFFPEGEERTARGLLLKKLMQGNYRIASCEILREKVLTAQRRADIYIDMTIQAEGQPYHLLVFLENKVRSGENDKQTDAYMDFMLDKSSGEFDFILPVFLYPVTNTALYSAATQLADENVSSKMIPCVNRLFLLLNYQYLVDGVLSPCQTAYKGERVHDILTDYISCLGKSIDDAAVEPDDSSAAVMAVSRQEKEWSCCLWEKNRDVLQDICMELSGAECESFLIGSESDAQFYRTVLSSVLSHLEDTATPDEELVRMMRDALTVKRRAGYSVKQQDGSVWTFVSGGRGKETLGALAYVVLRQYIIEHKEETAAAILEKLRPIRHSWLHNILVTEDELVQLSGAWLDSYIKNGAPVCECYYSEEVEDGAWTGCPLSDSSVNPVKRGDLAALQRHDCPLHSDMDNRALFEWYSGREPVGHQGRICACYYDFLHDFFVRDLTQVIQTESWEQKGISASIIFEKEPLRKSGINETFGAIQVDGWVENYVYVARYWGAATVEKLISLLGMADYVSTDAKKIQKQLDFMVEGL